MKQVCRELQTHEQQGLLMQIPKHYLGNKMATKAAKSEVISSALLEIVWTSHRTLTSLDLGMFRFQEQITWMLHVRHKQGSLQCLYLQGSPQLLV